MLSGQKKADAVVDLLSKLSTDLKHASWDDQQRVSALAQLKTYGRDRRNADALLSSAGIATLAEYSFGHYQAAVSREASRCIANALLLVSKLRQDFVDLGLLLKCAEKLRVQDDEEEFLMSRILFLLTYDTNVDFGDLVATSSLPASIEAHLGRHAKCLSDSGAAIANNGMESMALTEILKLLFNLSNSSSEHIKTFCGSVRPLFEIIKHYPTMKLPLQPPFSSAINALANLELPQWDATADLKDASISMYEDVDLTKLVSVLDSALGSYEIIELEVLLVPLLTVLRKVNVSASPECRKFMQRQLLPSPANRDLPIGQANDLPSRLLRLTTSSGMINLSRSISGLMFELSDKDANKYVVNVGYGFASGYLVSQKIPIPSIQDKSCFEASQGHVKEPVNPVTGQRLDKEPDDAGPEMTTEEKEREAERLFVLFERLKANGVIDVTNPLQQALQRGTFDHRVEEVEDSD